MLNSTTSSRSKSVATAPSISGHRFGDKSRRRTLSPHYAKESDLNKLVVTLDNNKNEMQCQIQSLCDKFERILHQKQREQHRDRYTLTPRRRRRIFSESDLSIPSISEHRTDTFGAHQMQQIHQIQQMQQIQNISNEVLIQQKSQCDQLRSEMGDLQNVVTQWRDQSDLDFRHILFAFSSFLNRKKSMDFTLHSIEWKESLDGVIRKCLDLKAEHNEIRSIFHRNIQRVDGEFVALNRKFMAKMKRVKGSTSSSPTKTKSVRIPKVKRLDIRWPDTLSVGSAFAVWCSEAVVF